MQKSKAQILSAAIEFLSVSTTQAETNAFDYYQKKVAGQIDHYSTSLDAFLTEADFNYEKINDESYGALSLEQEYRKGEFKTSIGVKLKLSLPKTKNKYRLIIESQSDSERDITEKETPANRDLTGNSFLVGVNYIAGEFNNWDTDYGFGIKTQLPINPFFEANADRSFEVNSQWDGGFRQKIRYYKQEKFETESRLFFANELNESTTLSFTTYVDWKEELDTMEYAQVVSLANQFNPIAEGVFEAGVSGSSLSNGRVNKVFIGYSFRKFLYKDKIIGTLSPEMVAERDYDFEVFPNLTARLDFIF